jgi:3-dehydroquinate dehydratase-1
MKKLKNALLDELSKHPMLVASLDGDDLPFLLEEAKTVRADLVEIRLDLWGVFFREDMVEKLARFKQKIGLPMLVSFRGGHPYPKWWQPYHWRALASAALIDLEWNPKYPWKDIRKQADQWGLGLIISHHDYDSTPPAKKLVSIVKAAYAKGADIVKLATKAKSEADVASLLTIAQQFTPKKRMTVMAMGAMGGLSRLASPLFGSCLTYGFIGSPTAIGQWHYKELQERVRQLYPSYDASFIERQKRRGALL